MPIVLAAALAGCGGGDSSGGDSSGGNGGWACEDIPVPGHEATGVRAQGASCADAADIVAAAVGKGRRAYEAAGFACEPSPADGGDTDYVCTRGESRVTFRYGAA